MFIECCSNTVCCGKYTARGSGACSLCLTECCSDTACHGNYTDCASGACSVLYTKSCTDSVCYGNCTTCGTGVCSPYYNACCTDTSCHGNQTACGSGACYLLCSMWCSDTIYHGDYTACSSGLCSVFCTKSCRDAIDDAIDRGVYTAIGSAVGCFWDGGTWRSSTIFFAAAGSQRRLIIFDGTPGSCGCGPDHCSRAAWHCCCCRDCPAAVCCVRLATGCKKLYLSVGCLCIADSASCSSATGGSVADDALPPHLPKPRHLATIRRPLLFGGVAYRRGYL